MFENAFNNIHRVLRNDEGLASELDYAEQTSWLLFLKYLDDLEAEREDAALLEGKDYTPILAAPYRWQTWAAPKKDGKLDHNAALTGTDLIDFVNRDLFPYLKTFRETADGPDSLDYKIGEIFSEIVNKFRSKAAFGDVATVINGGTPDSKVAGFWDGGVQWLTPKDIGKIEGREIANTPRTISEAGLAKSSARLVPPGSVILSTSAPIRHLAINTAAMAFNQGCRGIIPGKRLDLVFLYYFLLGNRQKIDDLGSGTTFKELSGTNLKAFEIPLPPLEEQKRIVAVLDQTFAALDRAHVQANLADAEGLFASLMAATLARFPSTRSAKLSELTEFITDGTHQTPKYFEAGHVFLSSKNVRDGRIDWNDVKYIDDIQHHRMQRCLSPNGNDILLRKNAAGYGKAAMVDREVVLTYT